MAPRNHKGVLAGLDGLAGSAVRKATKAVARETTDVVAQRIRKVAETGNDKRDYARLRKQLSAGLFKAMGTDALADSLAAMGTQAELIGITAARPVEESKVKRRKSKVKKERSSTTDLGPSTLDI